MEFTRAFYHLDFISHLLRMSCTGYVTLISAGFMIQANFFETFAKKPTISKMKGRMVYDSKAQPALQTEVYCTIKNFERVRK